MKPFFSARHTRYTAIVVLFVWLMTLGIGIANACLVNVALDHHVSAMSAQAKQHEGADAQPLASDKSVCLTVCDAEQTTTVNKKQLDASSDPQAVHVAFHALTIAVIDPNDRFLPLVSTTWCEPPVSIRFLRLTI